MHSRPTDGRWMELEEASATRRAVLAAPPVEEGDELAAILASRSASLTGMALQAANRVQDQEADPSLQAGGLFQLLQRLMRRQCSWVDVSHSDAPVSGANPPLQHCLRCRVGAVAGVGAASSAAVILWQLAQAVLSTMPEMQRSGLMRWPPHSPPDYPPMPPTPPPELAPRTAPPFHTPPPPSFLQPLWPAPRTPPPASPQPFPPPLPRPPPHHSPMPPPTSVSPALPAPPSVPAVPLVETLNARFNRTPWSLQWSGSGALGDAGVLIHVLDGWEQHGIAWAPATNGPGATDMSASLVFAASHVPGAAIPLFGAGRDLHAAGLVFKPGVTRIRCGKAVDSAGHCGGWCRRTSGEWVEAVDKLCAWRPRDFGPQLQRLTEYQLNYRRLFYNEIIIDAPWWRSHLPGVIEGIYGSRELHRAFVSEYGLDVETFPLLQLDTHNWESPFSLVPNGS